MMICSAQLKYSLEQVKQTKPLREMILPAILLHRQRMRLHFIVGNAVSGRLTRLQNFVFHVVQRLLGESL
jgi:hypothetical protein